MENDRKPFYMSYRAPRQEAVHPGRVISDILEHFHISQKEFSSRVGLSRPMVNRVLMGKAAVNPRFALLTESVTGLSAELLLNMQSRYELRAVKNGAFQQRLDRIRIFEVLESIRMPESIQEISRLYTDVQLPD